MQWIRPDMLPFIQGILIFVFVLIGLLSVIALIYGVKKRKSNLFTGAILLTAGVIGLLFITKNAWGYHVIYKEKEADLVGVFTVPDKAAVLEVNADYTWEITGAEVAYQRGTWEYVMSEDWCYWNLDSENGEYHLQVGSPNVIQFEKTGFRFQKR